MKHKSQPWRGNRSAFPLPTVARTSSGLPASPSQAGHEPAPCDQGGTTPWIPRQPVLLSKPRGTDRQILIVYFSTLAGILLWLTAIFLAPYFKSQSSPLNVLFYTLFSPVCHQIPSRSFIYFGYPLAVCSRCLGIYAGFLGGVGLFPIMNGLSTVSLPKVRLFILMSIPIGIDTLGNFMGLWVSSGWLRFASGFLWGLILPFYFICGLVDLVQHHSRIRGRG